MNVSRLSTYVVRKSASWLINPIYHRNIQFERWALLTSLPTSVLAKSFGHIVSPLLPNNEPHIPNVPYVMMEWSDKVSRAKSAPISDRKKNISHILFV